MKTIAALVVVLAMCAGCKPVSALPDPGITVTVTAVPGK